MAPDSGMRAAAEWVLHRWGDTSRLGSIEEERSRPKAPLGGALPTGKERWYVNTQGLTMAVIPPGEFIMGSPSSEPGRLTGETLHRRVIPHAFALAAKPVSVRQLTPFLKAHRADVSRESAFYNPDPDSAATHVTWYMAARYCRWLSEQEGIPETQMCFPPIAEIKEGMQLPADYRQRTGYRLPTEAEWEYACRAGATTARYYGDSDDLLGRYAWYVANSEDHAWPGGHKKPNDFGLFDMYGNVGQWCQDRYRPYPTTGVDKAVTDEDDVRVVTADQPRVLRGGGFTRRAPILRAAMRFPNLPTYSYINVGFRVARTMP